MFSIASSAISAELTSRTGISESITSLQQERFWLLDRLFPGNPAYNIAVRWKLAGNLDTKFLEQAINEVIRRQEALRTRFELRGDHPVQIVEEYLSIALSIVDLRGLHASARQVEEEKRTIAEARRPFDLMMLPLIRATLLQLSDDNYTLLVTMHHIVSDGWSIGIFVDELAAYYQALTTSTAPRLSHLPLTYSDYARQEWASLKSSQGKQVIDYWKRKLQNLPRCDVPTDRPRPPIQTSNGHIVSQLLPRALTNDLAHLASTRGMTLFMIAYAALCAALRVWTDNDDIVLGTSVTGRGSVETESLIGVFTNVLVLRTDVSDDPSFSVLFDRVRRTTIEALANQDLAFERLVEILRPRRDLSTSPLFSVNFIFQRSFIRNQTFAGIELTDIPSISPGSLYDLNFFMVERPEGWRLSCEYNTDLYESANVERMLSLLRTVLENIARDPEQRISHAIEDRTTHTISSHIQDTQVVRASDYRILESSQLETSRTIVKPRNSTESRLLEICKQALDISEVSVTEDLFELGATSLKAAAMVPTISRALGRRISLITVFRNPTIEKLALALSQEDLPSTAARVVSLQPLGAFRPFFFVECEPRFLTLRKHFSPYFAPDIPILSPIPDEALAQMRPYDIGKNAAYHVETILSLQPNGPYFIGGYSAGGVMAYEIARLLCARGSKVGLLVLFDTANPHFMGEHSSFERFKARQKERWTTLSELAPAEVPLLIGGRITERFSSAGIALRRLLHKAKLIEKMRPEDPPEDLFWERRAAARCYRPEPYPGRMLLFKRTKHLSGRYHDSEFGWGTVVCGGIEVCPIQSGHLDLFDEDNIGPIATTLRDRLYEIQASRDI